jgi:hypothetical protein
MTTQEIERIKNAINPAYANESELLHKMLQFFSHTSKLAVMQMSASHNEMVSRFVDAYVYPLRYFINGELVGIANEGQDQLDDELREKYPNAIIHMVDAVGYEAIDHPNEDAF